MKQDEQLFALCKEAYEKTGWEMDHEELAIYHGLDEPFRGKGTGLIYKSPFYTSDYLLQKLHELGRSITIDMFKDETIATDRKPTNKRNDNDVYDCWTTESGKNTLKALLKLTIALADAGELK